MGEQAELAWESGLYYLDDYDEGYDDSGDSYEDCTRYEQYNKETHWKQKNGKIIAISDMDISHVRNTVRMLRRKNFDWMIPDLMLEILSKNGGE